MPRDEAAYRRELRAAKAANRPKVRCRGCLEWFRPVRSTQVHCSKAGEAAADAQALMRLIDHLCESYSAKDVHRALEDATNGREVSLGSSRAEDEWCHETRGHFCDSFSSQFTPMEGGGVRLGESGHGV